MWNIVDDCVGENDEFAIKIKKWFFELNKLNKVLKLKFSVYFLFFKFLIKIF